MTNRFKTFNRIAISNNTCINQDGDTRFIAAIFEILKPSLFDILFTASSLMFEDFLLCSIKRGKIDIVEVAQPNIRIITLSPI